MAYCFKRLQIVCNPVKYGSPIKQSLHSKIVEKWQLTVEVERYYNSQAAVRFYQSCSRSSSLRNARLVQLFSSGYNNRGIACDLRTR